MTHSEPVLEQNLKNSRTRCKQCSNRILDATRDRNNGLCGLCNNWNFPESQRNRRNVANAKKGIRFAMQAATITFLLFIVLVLFTFFFIEFSMTFASLVSWGFSMAFALFFLCLSITLYQWGQKRASWSDAQHFEELKRNYRKRVDKENKRLGVNN